ncbi:MAG TPA: hypothetical protein VHW09_13615 [Bryobacteraceae bacterium]|jgi:hypothetical protein|nr:hypothetical protein [Bryobacteraceae bacterium]
MIWNAIKFITLSEIAAWIVFIAVTVVLGSFGIRSDAGGVQTVMMICWLVVFAVTYHFLRRRRSGLEPKKRG